MQSKIQNALAMSLSPVAILLSDDAPAGAARFQEGKWGCVMMMFATVATQGRCAAFDRRTYGCWGGGVGLGFGNTYRTFPGGEECFARFLSTGNAGWKRGEDVAATLPQGRGFAERFLEGERYVASPELASAFLKQLPMRDVPTRFVVFKPLADVEPERETPVAVVFPVNAHQLSALVVLANAGRDGRENVILPYAASCQGLWWGTRTSPHVATSRRPSALTSSPSQLHGRSSRRWRSSWTRASFASLPGTCWPGASRAAGGGASRSTATGFSDPGTHRAASPAGLGTSPQGFLPAG
jgi:uncharacterized protein (DUF169 family)